MDTWQAWIGVELVPMKLKLRKFLKMQNKKISN
jgi:hypothetical protein